jgi:hypothetical protein
MTSGWAPVPKYKKLCIVVQLAVTGDWLDVRELTRHDAG